MQAKVRRRYGSMKHVGFHGAYNLPGRKDIHKLEA
jgi:hypothetical protein